MFGMKALFPEAETHAPVSKDFGVSDCQGREVLNALAAGAQPVDAVRSPALPRLPRFTGHSSGSLSLSGGSTGRRGSPERGDLESRDEKTWGRWVLSGDAEREREKSRECRVVPGNVRGLPQENGACSGGWGEK